MEDKTFELIEKIYNEMQNKFALMQNGFKEVRKDIMMLDRILLG